jgi:hypothetical protein
MERKEILKHDDGSVTLEGDGLHNYLDHVSDHQKGRGEDKEHLEQYGHAEMHKIPHNENPISDWIGKGVDKVKEVAKGVNDFAEDYGKNISGTLTQNPQSLKKVRQKQEGAWQGIVE